MMTVLTGTLPASKTFKHQSWSFLALPSMDRPVLTIRQARSDKPKARGYVEQYEVDEDLDVPPGVRKVLLAKIVRDVGEAREYEVTVAADGYTRCTCDGFSSHRLCKHRDSVVSLLARLA